MKSSLHHLIPFFALILRPPVPKTRLHSIPLLPSSYPCRLASRNSILHFNYSIILCCWTLLYNHARTPRKTPSSIVEKACLLTCCLAIDVLWSSEFACAGICLPSRYLAIAIHTTILRQVRRCKTISRETDILLLKSNNVFPTERERERGQRSRTLLLWCAGPLTRPITTALAGFGCLALRRESNGENHLFFNVIAMDSGSNMNAQYWQNTEYDF
jgi:hypothetical protein